MFFFEVRNGSIESGLFLTTANTCGQKPDFLMMFCEGFQNFVDAGFVDTFRIFTQGNGHYSWWSHFANSRARNIGWRIDYLLVSAGLRGKVQSAAIHADVMGSDHCPVSITLK